MPTFTLRISKIADARRRVNPARTAVVRRFIQRFQRALAAAQVRLSRATEEEALDHFGLSPDGILAVLRALAVENYDHEEPAVTDPAQTIWFFHVVVPGPLRQGQTARVVIRETPGFYIIKFHRDIYDEE